MEEIMNNGRTLSQEFKYRIDGPSVYSYVYENIDGSNSQKFYVVAMDIDDLVNEIKPTITNEEFRTKIKNIELVCAIPSLTSKSIDYLMEENND
jgi:hypothetical protein